MSNIQKTQSIVDLHSKESFKPHKLPIELAPKLLDTAINDNKFRVYSVIGSILNVSSKILNIASTASFLGYLATWGYGGPILGISNEAFNNSSFKLFLGNLGLIIPNNVVAYLAANRLTTIFESNLPENIDLQNSSFYLTDKNIEVIDNATDEKTLIPR